jgi:hypothetical protein
MPRRPSPVDPAHGPAARFACELRRLRDDAGTPTYRALAEQTHFSKATLAAAAGGHRLPTLDVTLAYAQACGGDIDEWRKRWSQARTELGASEPAAPSDEMRPAAARRRFRPRARLVVGLAAIGITASVVGVLTVGGNNDATRHAPMASPSSVRSATGLVRSSARFVPNGALGAQSVADGADPKRTGCASDPDVRTLDSVEINTVDEAFLGIAELRYAPRCDVAWGRFTPAAGTVRLIGAVVTITASRPAPLPNTTRYETVFDGQAVFGNILLIRNICVAVTVHIVTALSGNAESTTHCLQGH